MSDNLSSNRRDRTRNRTRNRMQNRTPKKTPNTKFKYLALLGTVIFIGLLVIILSKPKTTKKDFLYYDSALGQIVVSENIIALDGRNIKFSHNDALHEYYFAYRKGEDISDYDFRVDNDKIEWIKLDKSKGVIIVKAKRALFFEAALDDKNNTVSITPSDLREKYDKIVVLDAGHGGDDEGASVNGIMEKDLNIAVVKKVYDLLEKSDTGIMPYLIRSGDETIPLTDRPFIGNDFADLFVSVHCNTFEHSSDPNGTETHYDQLGTENTGRTNLSNSEFAEIMQRNVLAQLNSRDRGRVGDAEYFVVVNSTMPAVLIELGYMTNPDEFAKLTTEAYQDLAAKGIYDGIVEAFGL